MNGKTAKILRKHSYKKGYHRSVEYEETINGEKICIGDRRVYLDLKKIYRRARKNGR